MYLNFYCSNCGEPLVIAAPEEKAIFKSNPLRRPEETLFYIAPCRKCVDVSAVEERVKELHQAVEIFQASVK